MTDRKTMIKGLEWWVKHQKGEVLPLAYSAVVETLEVLKEQEAVRPNLSWEHQYAIAENVNTL